tara:strand:+ start:370 stop:816 length:447 start_codon:yes stop_codon:yes gene_type:complete
MEINNRTVRLLSQTNNFTDENLWSFFEENFDLKLKSKQFLLKNKFILLDYNIINALKNNDVKEGDKIKVKTISKVLESKNDNFKIGEYILGTGCVQDYYISDGENCEKFDIDKFNYSENDIFIGLENFNKAFKKLIELEYEKKIILKP